jgi:D-alanyl-D-alanine carboxypeptidase/D-alanyl-D-alanine-endopeptidase (penicillin-binding protein 4)
VHRRTTLLAAVAASLGIVVSPASAVVLGPLERVPQVVPATALDPRPVELGQRPQEVPDTSGRDALRRRVEAALAGSTAGTVSVAVDVEGYGPLVRREADHPLPPASTQKSFVALSALVALGPDARYRTEVVSTKPVAGGRIDGPVWLVASGDPYFAMGHLRGLARRVRAAGVTEITGEVRLDDLRYDQRRTADGWKSSFMPRQSGPLSAMAVERNRWRRDATFLADPAHPAAVRFRDYLRAEGVRVRERVVRQARPRDTHTIAVHNGTPLPSAVRRALKTSDNFAAELMLKELGYVLRGDGSSAGGLAAVTDVLRQHGVPVGAGADGSGLSSRDRQTTVGQVRLLQAARDSGSYPQFRDALAWGCRDGTLRRRYCGTPAEGRVSAKTGTLNGVRALAGYTRTKSGRDVEFAFQLTGVQDGARALAAIDRAVVQLASATE